MWRFSRHVPCVAISVPRLNGACTSYLVNPDVPVSSMIKPDLFIVIPMIQVLSKIFPNHSDTIIYASMPQRGSTEGRSRLSGNNWSVPAAKVHRLCSLPGRLSLQGWLSSLFERWQRRRGQQCMP
ncbi:hypothetical protein FB451DRAFT_1213158 [Mycena latifolia]|nr:hypothetical protein FB451DRAFT_1213158 [Mycena latifolia]